MPALSKPPATFPAAAKSPKRFLIHVFLTNPTLPKIGRDSSAFPEERIKAPPPAAKSPTRFLIHVFLTNPTLPKIGRDSSAFWERTGGCGNRTHPAPSSEAVLDLKSRGATRPHALPKDANDHQSGISFRISRTADSKLFKSSRIVRQTISTSAPKYSWINLLRIPATESQGI